MFPQGVVSKLAKEYYWELMNEVRDHPYVHKFEVTKWLILNMSALLSSDTHPKMEALQIELIRRMPAWKKVSVVNDLNETIKTLAISGLKQQNPGATPEQIHRMLADLMLGEELARKVYDHAR